MSKKRYDTATVLADKLIEMLNKGVSPWHKSWNCGDVGLPVNWQGKRYRGMNLILLGMMGCTSPYWFTYRKCAELGGQVRKGEKGMPVMYWHRSQYKVIEDGEEVMKEGMVIRGYTVFNATQCDGLLDKFFPKPPKGKRHKPHAAASALWRGYKDAPHVRKGTSCAYSEGRDEIVMPDAKHFDGIGEYYAALFHEGCHSTGHAKRLHRDLTGRFGSTSYAKEELVAEIGAQMLCQRCGITRTLKNSAAYCQSWVKAIRDMPDYGRAIVCAAARAQKAADWITGEYRKGGNDE